MEILHKSSDTEGKFYIPGEDGEHLAELSYTKKGTTLAFDHTLTNPSLRGQGVAGKLLTEAVSYVREQGFKVMPECSYVVRKFDENPEQYQDIDARS